jgi:hypothetical protein
LVVDQDELIEVANMDCRSFKNPADQAQCMDAKAEYAQMPNTSDAAAGQRAEYAKGGFVNAALRIGPASTRDYPKLNT